MAEPVHRHDKRKAGVGGICPDRNPGAVGRRHESCGVAQRRWQWRILCVLPAIRDRSTAAVHAACALAGRPAILRRRDFDGSMHGVSHIAASARKFQRIRWRGDGTVQFDVIRRSNLRAGGWVRRIPGDMVDDVLWPRQREPNAGALERASLLWVNEHDHAAAQLSRATHQPKRGLRRVHRWARAIQLRCADADERNDFRAGGAGGVWALHVAQGVSGECAAAVRGHKPCDLSALARRCTRERATGQCGFLRAPAAGCFRNADGDADEPDVRCGGTAGRHRRAGGNCDDHRDEPACGNGILSIADHGHVSDQSRGVDIDPSGRCISR